MKYSTKLSDTVHVMVLIAINKEKSLSSASIAESVHTNPGFVRQLMLKLKKAGLMTSVAGHARPSLSKPADQITLLDIYKAVEDEKPLLHLDTLAPNPYDSTKRPVRFRGLFDVKMAHADDAFYLKAMQMIRCDSVASFLKEVQPKNPFYYQLLEKLKAGGLNKAMRNKIICNMERCRWRQYDNPWQHEKYVVVNIPSFHLMAIDHQDTLSMRIGCGANKTKTPILNSHIKRMELNPQWFVPRSIVIHDMMHRVGNHAYFHSRNYYVREVATGKEVDLNRVTRSMLLSGAYGIAQRGGKGNALGRIIFRFDNNFSVFLHDTNSKGVFGREDRGVSHGCVRIEKPYDFAVFLLADKNKKLKEKIYYSMTADSLANKKLVVSNVKVNPQVPLFITYYTLYPFAGGRIAEYSDVYGFDAVIFNMLRKYL